MPASMQSVTTRGFGIAGGFTGDANLVVTLGYGIGEQVFPATVGPALRIPGRDGATYIPPRDGAIRILGRDGSIRCDI